MQAGDGEQRPGCDVVELEGFTVAERVFVHVGAPKAGTTYLQSILWSNQDVLGESGVLLPGEVTFDHNRVAQAVRSEMPSRAAERTWGQVLRQIHDWPGDAVISNEWFTLASQAQAERMIDLLRPSEVHVVFTARNLLSAVPSAWQQLLKVGIAQSPETFVDSLDSEEPGARWTWSNLDPALALRRWSRAIPRTHVHVVTVPTRPSDPDLLWKRFANTCGIPPDSCDLSTIDGNESLGAQSARLLQLVGSRLRTAIDADNGPWREPYRWIWDFLADHTLVPLGGDRIALDDNEVDLIRAHSHRSVATLREAGYDVVGDLDELTQDTLPSGAVRPEDVDPDQVIERAGEAMAALLRRARDETHRADERTARIQRLEKRVRRQQKRIRDQQAAIESLRARRPATRIRRLLTNVAGRHPR